MKNRENITAIAIGIITGCFLALIYINIDRITAFAGQINIQTITSRFKNTKPVDINFQTDSSQNPEVNNIEIIEIKEPKDGSILDKAIISLSGKVKPGIRLFADDENDLNEVPLDEDGEFSLKLNLSEGPNTIILHPLENGIFLQKKEVNLLYLKSS